MQPAFYCIFRQLQDLCDTGNRKAGRVIQLKRNPVSIRQLRYLLPYLEDLLLSQQDLLRRTGCISQLDPQRRQFLQTLLGNQL